MLALVVVLPLALLLACGGESFSLSSSPEQGTESCKAVMGLRPGRPRPPRGRVALSLLVGQVDLHLAHMLKTLTGSDVNDHDVGLFAWVNFPYTAAHRAMKRFAAKVAPVLRWKVKLMGSGGNLGIFSPRVRIWERVMADGFDYLVELHDDMSFPKVWLNELLLPMSREVAYTHPFMVTKYSPLNQSWTELCKVADRFGVWYADVTRESCHATHPWVLNLPVMKAVGYYDESYSPQYFGDFDLEARIDAAGLKTLAVQSSWVGHYRTLTRLDLGEGNKERNKALFHSKFNESVQQFGLRKFKCFPWMCPKYPKGATPLGCGRAMKGCW